MPNIITPRSLVSIADIILTEDIVFSQLNNIICKLIIQINKSSLIESITVFIQEALHMFRNYVYPSGTVNNYNFLKTSSYN